GVPEENLVLVDMNEVFCKALTRRYGKARVVHGPAQDLPGLGLGALECVVSGLPMLNFPASLQKDILGAVFAVLGSGGKLVQFTYGARPPVERELLQAMHLEWRLRGRVWRNLPPANVYEFFRHAPPG
ncbi:MAG: class I SAM-dependent methyltransferase, partial [Paracoccaceae bacterium]